MPGDDPIPAIRRAITLITQQRDAVAANATTAMVDQALVQQAVRRQYEHLALARAQVDTALASARRLADTVRAEDGPVAATSYAMHADGLQTQRDVIDAAAAQLDGFRDSSVDNVQRARTLLVTSTRALDAALREQLRLLVAVERLERARLVAEARTSAAPRGAGNADQAAGDQAGGGSASGGGPG